MASEAISIAILTIATTIVVMAIVSAIYSQAYTLDSLAKIIAKSAEDRIKTDIRIVHIALNASNNMQHLVVFVKNVGLRPISPQELVISDVYAGTGACGQLYTYSATPQPNRWSYIIVDANSDGLWSPGETLIVRIYSTTAFRVPICVKIVLPNGISHEALSDL